ARELAAGFHLRQQNRQECRLAGLPQAGEERDLARGEVAIPEPGGGGGAGRRENVAERKEGRNEIGRHGILRRREVRRTQNDWASIGAWARPMRETASDVRLDTRPESAGALQPI